MPDRKPTKQFKFPEDFMRVDFGERIGYADLVIEQHGYRMWYEPMIWCPCISIITTGGFSIEKGTGQPNPACPKCKGTGRIYLDGKETKGLVFGLNRRVLEFLRQLGRVEAGTYMATIHSEITVNYFDRFYLIDVELPITELFIASPDKKFILSHNPVKILKIFIHIPDLNNPENSQVEEITVNDYLMDYDNAILEITKDLPEQYSLSVKYLGSPWFYVNELLHFYRMQYVKEHLDKEYKSKLPTQVVCKRGDLIKTG